MSGLSFRTRILGALKRYDFAGDHANVSVPQDGMTLSGSERGFLHVPYARVKRVRVGFTETKNGLIYEAKIWLDGERAPLRFFPYDNGDWANYRVAMRGLAAQLNTQGQLARVERGVSKFDAALGPALMA